MFRKLRTLELGRAKGLSTLRARIFWWLIPTIVLLFVVLTVIDFYRHREVAEQEFAERGNEMSINLANSSRLAVFVEDSELLASAMRGVAADADVAYVIIYGENWKILANQGALAVGSKGGLSGLSEAEKSRLLHDRQTLSRQVTTQEGRFVEFLAPILRSALSTDGAGASLVSARSQAPAKSSSIGAVRVGLSLDRMDAYLTELLQWRGTLTLTFLLLSTVLIYTFSRPITQPINRLTDHAREIADGRLDQQIPVESRDEIGRLAGSFNEMAQALQKNMGEKEDLLGQLQGLNTTLEDRIRERTAALENANSDLELATKHKSEFLANVNHELRTPLTAILGYARLVRRGTAGQIPPLQEANLDNLLQNADHLLRMINSLLDLSKIEAGRMEVREEPVAIDEAIAWSIATVGPMVNERTRLNSEIAPDLPVLYSDNNLLRQIILNLLSNAAKFTDEGEIKVWAEQDNGALRLGVSDTGIGMTEAEMDQIFGEFRRGETLKNRMYVGTGLGLAIVKQLAGFLGGDIAVDSQVGKGSAFTMTLPWVRVEHVSGGKELPA
jgi:signal transduction histidine kinase